MDLGNHIIYEPNYKKIIQGIISEYPSIKEYNNDENNYFNNIHVTFYTKVKPDSIYSTIRDGDRYYITMSIEEMRNIIKKCYDSDPFSNDLLINVIRYLPSNFFENLGLHIPNKRDDITINLPRFIPNNRDDIIILDDLTALNNFIKKYKDKLHDYEIRKLCYITMRLNSSREILNHIEYITGSSKCTKFLLKDNGEIQFINKIDNRLNNSLAEYNNIRQNHVKTLYNATGDERYLSDDTMYKIVITKNLEEWDDIFHNIKFFDSSRIKKVINSYDCISDLMSLKNT